MKGNYITYLIIVILITYCKSKTIKKSEYKDSISLKKSNKKLTYEDSLQIKVDTLLKKSKPILGYRFVIFGDFNGDNINDTLVERYTDSLKNKETNKYYENLEYDEVIFLNFHFGKKSFLYLKNFNSQELNGGDLGIHYAENCGDLNNDGKDEVLVVPQNADWSHTNHAHIYSLINKKWKEIYSIPIWEWQFPLTPSVSMIPGLFGNFNIGITNSDTSDKKLENELKNFHFIKHYSDNSIEFESMNPFDYEEVNEGMENYGQQEYIKKHFKKIYIGDSLYLQDKKQTAFFYKNVTEENLPSQGKILLFPIDDPASLFKTRIYLNKQDSPFK